MGDDREHTGPDGGEDEPATHRFGTAVVGANLIGTAIFGVTAAYAAISFSTVAQWVGAVTALALFTVGVFSFLWAYWNAVQRSRHEEISVTQLYLLAGPPTPRWVKRRMWLSLAAQVTIATVTTLARPDGPDGNPGSSLAVGFLVPMFGIGLNGLWAAFHGRFPPRERRAVATTDHEIGQNADHG
jgi:hypothetical protein